MLAAVVPFGPVHRWRLQRSVHDEAGLTFPGSTLMHADWQDEEHARYIDTGGYDTPAGWSREYDHPPFAVGDLLAFYRSRLRAEGWREVHATIDGCHDGGEVRLSFARRGELERSHRMFVSALVHPEEIGTDCAGATASTYEVDYRLPWRKEPSY